MIISDQHSTPSDGDWEIDDTLLAGHPTDREPSSSSRPDAELVKHDNPKNMDSYTRISLTDLELNPSTSKSLPYTRIHLVP
jgi:hypothetical protein